MVGYICHLFNDNTNGYRDHHHQDNGNIDRQGGGCVNHNQARHHKHIAVGKVDQTEDAVDHGVANGNQRILSADGDAGEQVGQIGR